MILAVALASEVHGREYYLRVLNEFKEGLSRFKYIEFFNDVVTRKDSIKSLPRHDLLLIIHLTGGTSGLAKYLMQLSRAPTLLLAHSKHNSLASALSAKAWGEFRGFKVKLLYVDPPKEVSRVFEPISRGYELFRRLHSLKVLEINASGEVSPSASILKKVLNSEVVAKSFNDVIKHYERLSSESINEVVSKLNSLVITELADLSKLRELAKLYLAIKELIKDVGANVVAIDCFPYIMNYGISPCLVVALLNDDEVPTICEADHYSIIPMVIAQELTGGPGWIGNPSGLSSDGYVRLAHCTIATKLCLRKASLVTHMESGKPYAVTCPIKHREVLLLRTSLDMRKIYLYEAEVIRSGYLEDDYCRTQIHLKIKGLSGREFIEGAKGNHHVVIPKVGNIEEVLKVFSWLANVEVIKLPTYSESRR